MRKIIRVPARGWGGGYPLDRRRAGAAGEWSRTRSARRRWRSGAGGGRVWAVRQRQGVTEAVVTKVTGSRLRMWDVQAAQGARLLVRR